LLSRSPAAAAATTISTNARTARPKFSDGRAFAFSGTCSSYGLVDAGLLGFAVDDARLQFLGRLVEKTTRAELDLDLLIPTPPRTSDQGIHHEADVDADIIPIETGTRTSVRVHVVLDDYAVGTSYAGRSVTQTVKGRVSWTTISPTTVNLTGSFSLDRRSGSGSGGGGIPCGHGCGT
jgi:hypothetical protein